MKERNEIEVTDNCDNRIQVFSSDGIFLRLFGRNGDKQVELSLWDSFGYKEREYFSGGRF